MKNLIYGGIIVVCLIIAGIVVFAGGSGDSGIDSLSNETQKWVKCRACNASYQMGEKEFFEKLKQKSIEIANPMVQPRLTCEKCNKDAVMEAVKCDECGEVFFKGTVPNDFPDRCPKCKHSATEARREASQG